MQKHSKSLLGRVSTGLFTLVLAFNPLLPLIPITIANAQELSSQSIEICFINFDKDGNILESLPGNTSIGINLYTDPGHLVEGQVNTYGTTFATVQQTFQPVNKDLLGSDGAFDSYCVTKEFTNTDNHEYTYTPATIDSNLDWLPIRYNDQNNIDFVDLDIAFPYSGEWFDAVVGNEADRNTNSDGHIIMSSDRLHRRLIVVSEQDQNLPQYAVEFSDGTPTSGEYTLSTVPSTLNMGQSIDLRFSVQNMGELIWLPGDNPANTHPVNTSYHWQNAEDNSYPVYDGNRAILNQTIDYTQNDSNIALQVDAPTAPGNYKLVIDLVHEGVTWFSEQGANTFTIPVTIESDAAPITEPTPQPARSLAVPQATVAATSTGSYYTVQPYQGGNWHCGGYDCLSGIAEDYYHCSTNGIPNDAVSGDMTQKCWWPIYEANLHLYTSVPPVYASTPWNYIQVGWVLYIPPFDGGPVTPPPPVNSSNFGGIKGASTFDPYAGMNGAYSAWPKVTFDRFVAWDGSYKTDQIKWSETQRPQTPTITGIQTNATGSAATIYGVAIPKNHPMHVAVWNEFRYCWACGSGWEYKYQKGTAQHVKVVIFKNNWEYIGQVWNDRTDGRWNITLPLGSTLKSGDRIFAEVQVEADYTFGGLKWWSDTYETVNFNLRNSKYTGYPYFGSGGGNSVTIPSVYVDKRSVEERWIDQLATVLGSTGGSSLTNICGAPAKTYARVTPGESTSAGAIIFVNGRAIYTYGGTWDTFNYYGDKCSRFGVPINNPNTAGAGPYNTPGAYQDFQKGRIYWSWKHVGKFLYGAIWSKFEQAGGTNSAYGWPTSETYQTTLNGVSNVCQNFEGGIICEKDPVDPTTQKFRSKELNFGNINRLGEIHDYCGTKIQDYNQIGSFGRSSLILNPTTSNVQLLTGGLAYTYFNNGSCDKFGYPTNDPGTTSEGNGWWQNFSKDTTIYWHKTNTKAQGKWVSGAMRVYHNSLGGSSSPLGFPVEAQWTESSYCGVSGEMQHFENGKAYRSPIASTWIEYGGWFDLQNKYGIQGINGLGWPSGKPENKGIAWSVWQFERGELNWDFNNDYITDNFLSCGNLERQDDPEGIATQRIHEAEQRLLNAFQRTEGVTGAVHNFCTVNGKQSAIVDYSSAYTKQTGGNVGYSWMIYNPDTDRAYLLYGALGQSYWNAGDCTKLGLPTNDLIITEQAGSQHSRVDSQTFTKGNLYWRHDTNDYAVITDQNIIQKYEVQGGLNTQNKLSLPKGSTGNQTGSCNIAGTYQEFDNGKIYASPRGTYFIDTRDGDATLRTYKSGGEAASNFEWPVTDRIWINGGDQPDTSANYLTVFHRGYMQEREASLISGNDITFQDSGWSCTDDSERKTKIRLENEAYLASPYSIVPTTVQLNALRSDLSELNKISVKLSIIKAKNNGLLENFSEQEVIQRISDISRVLDIWDTPFEYRMENFLIKQTVLQTASLLDNNDDLISNEWIKINAESLFTWGGYAIRAGYSAYNNPTDFIEGAATGSVSCVADNINLVLHFGEIAELVYQIMQDPSLIDDINQILLFEAGNSSDSDFSKFGGRLVGESICEYALGKGISKIANLSVVRGAAGEIKGTLSEIVAPIAKYLRRANIAEYIDSAGAWLLGPGDRGDLFDELLGNNLGHSFPTIDRYEEELRLIRSFKSVDLTATTYQSATGLRNKLKQDIQSLINFSEGSLANIVISPDSYDFKQIDFIFPNVTPTDVQSNVLNEMIDFAELNNIRFNVIIAK